MTADNKTTDCVECIHCPETQVEKAIQKAFTTQVRMQSDILDIDALSTLLNCSVDTIRRIPVNELPVYRVGKNNLYLRDEVLTFLRSRRVTTANTAFKKQTIQHVDELLEEVLSSASVDVREPSRKRAK